MAVIHQHEPFLDFLLGFAAGTEYLDLQNDLGQVSHPRASTGLGAGFSVQPLIPALCSCRQPFTWQPSWGRPPQWRSCTRRVPGCMWRSVGATQRCTWPAARGHTPALVCYSSPVPGAPGEPPTPTSLRALIAPLTPTTRLLPCTPNLTRRRKMKRVRRIGSCSWKLKTTRVRLPSHCAGPGLPAEREHWALGSVLLTQHPAHWKIILRLQGPRHWEGLPLRPQITETRSCGLQDLDHMGAHLGPRPVTHRPRSTKIPLLGPGSPAGRHSSPGPHPFSPTTGPSIPRTREVKAQVPRD